MRHKKTVINLSLILILLYSGCGVHENSQDEDLQELESLRGQITDIIGDALSDDPADCRVLGIGAKPCGGPWDYVVYSIVDTDTLLLQAKIEQHYIKEDAYNQKWGISSDCMFVGLPDSLICEDGRCVEVY